jgi:putative ABC transport system substrate-binding protein
MRQWLLLILVLAAALCGSAGAQDRVFRLGVLSPTGAGSGFTTIRTVTVPELATLGFIEGQNLVIDYRVAGGLLDRLPALAQELVQGSPDVIITSGPFATRAARQATGTIPIVMVLGEDPVAAGLVASLARPGGNVTGFVLLGPELEGKRLELLHEAVPDRRRIAVLVEPGVTRASHEAMEPVARSLGLELLLMPVHDANYAAAFEAIRPLSPGALVVPTTTQFLRDVATITALATEHRLPTVCQWAEMAHAGCLIGYGSSLADLRRRSAHYVARILRGTPPGDLPVERASVFDLTINLKTSKALGIEIPAALLTRADEVIE